VTVPPDLPLGVQLLGCREVGVCSIGEETGFHPFDIHDNIERRVSRDISTIGRVCELAARHVGVTGNITHRRRVARASFNLLAVCEPLFVADAEVDKIVGADEGVCFTGTISFAVDLLNNRGVQCSGGLRISPSITAGGRVVVSTALVLIPLTLTGYNTIRLRDEEGNRELCDDEENERELETLHGSVYRYGRDVDLGEKTV